MKHFEQTGLVREGKCAQPSVCPLSRIPAGTVVCIKRLATSRDLMARLREMGMALSAVVPGAAGRLGNAMLESPDGTTLMLLESES